MPQDCSSSGSHRCIFSIGSFDIYCLSPFKKMSPVLTYQMAPLYMACLPSGICFDKSKHQGYVIFPAKYNIQFIRLATYAFLSHAKKIVLELQHALQSLGKNRQREISLPLVTCRTTWKEETGSGQSLNQPRWGLGGVCVQQSGGDLICSRFFRTRAYSSSHLKMSRSSLFQFLQKILIF